MTAPATKPPSLPAPRVLYCCNDANDGTVFVSGDGAFVGYVHENDGQWRGEYFGCVARYFGGSVVDIVVRDDGAHYGDDVMSYCAANVVAIRAAIAAHVANDGGER